MLRSVYTKTLRDMRWGILGWGAGLGVLVLATGVAWAIAYPDATARTQLAEQLHGGLSAAQVFYGPSGHIDTLGGFVEWRALGLGPVLLGLYLILAATGMTRGAEESRTMEVVVGACGTRRRLLGQQIAALAAATVVITVLMATIAAPTAIFAGEPNLVLPRVAGAAANVGVAALFFGSAGLAAAQVFTRRRSAALAATGFMIVSHLTNTLPLVVPEISGARYASPSRLYTASSPLADGDIEWAALATLAALATGLAALAIWATERRDLFDTLHARRSLDGPATPLTAPRPRSWTRYQLFFRNSAWRGFRDSLGSVLAWGAGLSLIAVFMTALAPNIRQSLLEQANSVLAQQLEKAGATSERSILSLVLFSFVPPLVTVFALTLAASWAGDELTQRLELELSCPPPRWKVLLQRLTAAAGAVAVTVLILTVATALTIELAGVDVPVAALATAMGALALLGCVVVAMGFAIASWRPGLVVAIGGAVIAVSYFANLLIPLFELPDWVRNLSMFGLYGSPLADGVSFWRLGVLAGAGLAFAGAAAAAFQRRDVLK
jgi:ABC-2 type transport system permease protein